MPEKILSLNKEQIKKFLPHRDPFLFVDEITEVIPGKSVIGKKVVRKDEFFFKGHFPGLPIFPGAILIETLAQVSAFIILTMPGKEKLFGLFTGVDKFRFKKVVKPGDVLTIKSHVISYGHNVAKSEGKIFVNNKVVAEGVVSAMFIDKKKVMEAK
ncbi:MAG: 3-hydroxyacyl-ACP dehydratase FabZ [Caldisericaceae bacterium]|nr:3-hydroxyacyl-ACP dehydratase FabZ [Caldisericaceae bacterium]